MKKVMTILAVLAIALVVSSFAFAPTTGQIVDVREVSVGGHSYVVATSMQSNPVRPGGVSIIHSAGCPCLKKK